MKIRRIYTGLAVSLAAALMVAGCGHTNNLAKYDVQGRTAIFRASSSAHPTAFTLIESPTEDNTVVDILAGIGSGIAADQARKKLARAIDGDSLALGISQGIRRAVVDYLSIRPVTSMDQNPDFIIETHLTDYKLVSTAWGLNMRVEGRSRVIDRKTGGIVWEDCESRSIPLSETFLAGLGPRPVSSGASIFNVVRLLNLSEAEIAQVLQAAGEHAGEEIGETLREDVAEMHGR